MGAIAAATMGKSSSSKPSSDPFSGDYDIYAPVTSDNWGDARAKLAELLPKEDHRPILIYYGGALSAFMYKQQEYQRRLEEARAEELRIRDEERRLRDEAVSPEEKFMRELETEERLREVVSVRYAVLRRAEIVGKRYNEASLVIRT